MNNNHRKQMLYQKTSFNNYLICQLPSIFRCIKCKKNNNILVEKEIKIKIQNCLFCGTPNFTAIHF
jgi:transcription elongation factor Elf1